MFISTPQSIAKPSPGWNKVVLLTVVRNSSCSCQFSVSLHPPQAALNSEPRPGRLLGTTTNQKLSPRAGKVAANVMSRRKGNGSKCQLPREVPLPSRLTPRHLPRKRGRLKLQYKLGVQCRTPSRSDRFNGVTGGCRGDLRGEIEIFPGPPAKRL